MSCIITSVLLKPMLLNYNSLLPPFLKQIIVQQYSLTNSDTSAILVVVFKIFNNALTWTFEVDYFILNFSNSCFRLSLNVPCSRIPTSSHSSQMMLQTLRTEFLPSSVLVAYKSLKIHAQTSLYITAKTSFQPRNTYLSHAS